MTCKLQNMGYTPNNFLHRSPIPPKKRRHSHIFSLYLYAVTHILDNFKK